MRLEEQAQKIPIIVENEPQDVFKKNGSLLPNVMRCVVSGPSGCGKTQALLSLIYQPNGLNFASIYLLCKSADQPKYQRLQHVISGVPDMHCYVNNVKDVNELMPFSLVICDDVTSSNQSVIKDIFSMGRHKNIDVFYLTQTYTAVPKHLIRDNVNSLIIFQQDQLNLLHIFNNHVVGDMKFSKFKELCEEAWREPFSFLFVVKSFPLENGRYRKGFDKYFKDINS